MSTNIIDLWNTLLNYNAKIIHQIWFNFKDKYDKSPTINPPDKYSQYISKWVDVAKHNNYYYHIWNNSTARAFITTFYPEFLNLYETFPKEIQRVDFLKYAILHKFGGIYVDIDAEWAGDNLNIAKLLNNYSKNVVIGREIHYICPSNYFIVSKNANNPALLYIMEYVETKYVSLTDKNKVVEITGAFMLDECLNNRSEECIGDVELFNFCDVSPEYWKFPMRLINRIPLVTHYYAGSWGSDPIVMYFVMYIIMIIICVISLGISSSKLLFKWGDLKHKK